MTNPRYLSITALLGILLGLLCNSITHVFNQPYGAQSIGVIMNIEQFLFAAAAIERAIEAFKRVAFARFLTGDEHATARQNIAFVLSLIVGLIVAWGFSLNMFADFGAAYAIGGTLLTGLIIGGGSNLVHQAWELWTQIRGLISARVERAENQAALLAPENSPPTYTFPKAG